MRRRTCGSGRLRLRRASPESLPRPSRTCGVRETKEPRAKFTGVKTLPVFIRIVANSSPIQLSSAGLFGKGCDRSLGAPLAHIEGSTYLGQRTPVRAQRGHTQSIHLNTGPSELLPLRPCVSQTSPNALRRGPGGSVLEEVSPMPLKRQKTAN